MNKPVLTGFFIITMPNITYPIIILFCFAVCLLQFIFLIYGKRKARQELALLANQIQSNEVLTTELRHTIQTMEEKFTKLSQQSELNQQENEQVSKQLEHRIKVLSARLEQQQSAFEQINNQQPEDKLYSRAMKMVELGADIEEVIRECEIPRAEAEMLISVHYRKIKQK